MATVSFVIFTFVTGELTSSKTTPSVTGVCALSAVTAFHFIKL